MMRTLSTSRVLLFAVASAIAGCDGCVGTVGDLIDSAPSNLIAVAKTQISVELSWKDNSSTETGFVIERADAADGPFAQLTTLAANTTDGVDDTAVPHSTYFYRVGAMFSEGP